MSFGKITTLKPFFITHPTDKEMALCLCKICLNVRLVFKVIMDQEKKDGGKITESSTEFFMSTAGCEKQEIGYYKWKCVTQKCKACKDKKPMALTCQDSETVRKVSQFETTKTPYEKTDDGNSVNKISTKTEKVEHELRLKHMYALLAGQKKKYLMHRYQVIDDNHHRPRILSTLEIRPIYHLDFSENLAQMYKD